MADFAASSLDYVAGFVSDRTGSGKLSPSLAYAFSTLAKTIIALQSTLFSAGLVPRNRAPWEILSWRPRDAWISSMATQKDAGFSLGPQGHDKSGAILGPIGAYFILDRLGETASTFKILFLVAWHLRPWPCCFFLHH